MNLVDDIRIVHPLFWEDAGSILESPKQLNIGVIHVSLAQQLNRLWHSVLPETDINNLQRVRILKCFGAEFAGKFYATAIWTDPIAGNRMTEAHTILELRRFAIAPDAPRNTASRMLSLMSKKIKKDHPMLKTLISYQAVDHHHGTIYKAANWVASVRSKSSVWHRGEVRSERQTTSDKVRWEIKI